MRRALVFAEPYKKGAGSIFVLTLFIAAINATEPVVTGWIFNWARNRNLQGLLRGVGILAGLALGRELASAVPGFQWANASASRLRAR
jgi:hypothetical protein